MTVDEALKERARGAAFYRSLSPREQGEFGDRLVLGDFDWRDWMEHRPSRAFLNGADYERMLTEV